MVLFLRKSGFGLSLLLLLILLFACQDEPVSDLPTPYPTEYLPTVIAMTADAMRATVEPMQASPSPTATSEAMKDANLTVSPSETLDALSVAPESVGAQTSTLTPAVSPTPTRWSSRTPTVTLTPELPVAAIQILEPGPMSKVLSPLRVYTYLKLGPTYRTVIELIGEDGRLLLRQVDKYSEENPLIGFLEEVEFEISGVSEKARLVISTDDTFGRIVSLASVELILLSYGQADLNPDSDVLETIVIRQPAVNSLIQGGVVTVAGQARLERGEVLISMMDGQGKLVGYQSAPVNASEGQLAGFGAFSVDVPYLVDSPTWVRLSVSQSGSRPDGMTHLSSIEVLLSP